MSINEDDEQIKFAKELISIEENSNDSNRREIVKSLATIAGLAFSWAGDGNSSVLYDLMEYFDCRLESIDGNNTNSGWLKKDRESLDEAIDEYDKSRTEAPQSNNAV